MAGHCWWVISSPNRLLRLYMDRLHSNVHCNYDVTYMYVCCMLYSSSLGAAYIRQWAWSVLLQVMACGMFGIKPLPKQMLTYCQLDPWEQTCESLNSNENTTLFIHEKSIWKCGLQNDGHLFDVEHSQVYRAGTTKILDLDLFSTCYHPGEAGQVLWLVFQDFGLH